MSIEELSSKGSPACQEAFAFLRDQLKASPNVEETVEYEPLKESEAPTYNVRKHQEFEFSSERNWRYSSSFQRRPFQLSRLTKPYLKD